MNRIIVFVKAPLPGLVKTRLCPPLSEIEAARLYRAFARDTLGLAEGVRDATVEVAYAPGEGFENVDWIRARPAVRSFSQQGRDLGERLVHAFGNAFSNGAQKTVVIGSDTPHISSETISTAFSLLDINDAVIGPAQDGGYYLIGLKRARAELFQGISWSTDKVFQETVERARELDVRLARLSTLADIDTFADLTALARRLKDSPVTACPATRLALKQIVRTEPKHEILVI